MRTPLTASFVFNRRVKPSRSTEVIVASIASIPACDIASKTIASTWSAFMWARMPGAAPASGSGAACLVVPRINPAHHTEAPDVVEIDGLKTEEAEVGEVHPIAAVLVAGEIDLSNRSEVVFWHGLGVSDQGRSGSPKGITIGTRLCDEEAASRVSLQILGVHCHIADQEDGPACRIEGEGHQGTEGKPGCLRDSVERVATEASDMRVRTRSA